MDCLNQEGKRDKQPGVNKGGKKRKNVSRERGRVYGNGGVLQKVDWRGTTVGKIQGRKRQKKRGGGGSPKGRKKKLQLSFEVGDKVTKKETRIRNGNPDSRGGTGGGPERKKRGR